MRCIRSATGSEISHAESLVGPQEATVRVRDAGEVVPKRRVLYATIPRRVARVDGASNRHGVLSSESLRHRMCERSQRIGSDRLGRQEIAVRLAGNVAEPLRSTLQPSNES